MSFGIPRFVANRFAVPAGMIARLVVVPASTSTHRWTIPSPPQTKRSSAPSSSARRTWAGALRLFGTSNQSGSVTPSASRTRRSSGRPPPSGLAGVRDDRDLHSRPPALACARSRTSAAAPAVRHAKTRAITAAMPTTTPPATSSGWCIPRYIRARATNVDHREDERPGGHPECAVGEARGEQENEAAVDSDCGCRMTGRVAGVHRQAFETRDSRPMRVDDECRRAVGRRTRRPARRRRTPRSATSAARRKPTATEPTMIGSTNPPAAVEPTHEASVRAGVRCRASHTLKPSPPRRRPRHARPRA